MYKWFAFLFSLFLMGSAYSAESMIPTPNIDSPNFRTTDEILYGNPDDTKCATAIFANALARSANTVSEYDDEFVIQQWIYETFAKPDVLTAVLACPEIQSIADDETVRFMPIQYTFPSGRQITINYETQPKILQQRIIASSKRDTDSLNNPNPRIGALGDDSVWTNTDPAWYAIMVVQHGAMDEFVGPNKNNTISIKYINDNINKLYPHGATCTSKSALANDTYMINRAVHETVNVDGDTNDYYVAGDVNLHWISYAEIAVDVVITVATFGGGMIIKGVTKSARASRIFKNLTKSLRTLSQSPEVVKYIRLEQKLQRAQRATGHIKKYQQLEKELAAIDKVKDSAKYADKLKDLETTGRQLREIDKITDTTKYADKLADLEKETVDATKQMQEAIKTHKDVKQYAEIKSAMRELSTYAKAYKNFHNAKAGNIAVRTWHAFRAATSGGKTLSRTAKLARGSMTSGRVRDWLFQSTAKNLGALAALTADASLLYAALKILGGMYDWTEVSTGDFTNGVEFKPLLLLSADDLEGQENEVNYGMWLLWSGDSTSPTDDDAAYLQAFDFADKFHMDLEETMEKYNNHSCNVDIYVVRPVLRNPGTNDAELYYLIMNDKPWTTAE